MLFIEADEDIITLNGEVVSNLEDELRKLGNCPQVHLMVDKNLDHGKVVELMKIVKAANCQKISVQSI